MRGILVSRFFLNLRHVFFRRDNDDLESLESLRIRIPTISADDLVGNLGAPLRTSPISGPRASASSGPSRQRRSRIGADPLLDWDVDDEDLEDVEITSRRPILAGLRMDPNKVGESSVSPLWRKEFDGMGVEGEEIVSLVNRNGSNGDPLSPVQSTHSSKGEGDRESLPPARQPSKSTVDEGDALLVEMGEEGWDRYSREQARTSIASTVNSSYQAREITPARMSYFG